MDNVFSQLEQRFRTFFIIYGPVSNLGTLKGNTQQNSIPTLPTPDSRLPYTSMVPNESAVGRELVGSDFILGVNEP